MGLLLVSKGMQPTSLGVTWSARGGRFASAAHPAPPLTLAADTRSVGRLGTITKCKEGRIDSFSSNSEATRFDGFR
jgi:hypothetical protein